MSASKRTQQTYGAYASWANTPDRSVRTAPARKAGPGSDEYWLAQKREDPKFAGATDRQILDAARAAKKAYYACLALKSAKARSRGGDAA